MKKIILRVSTMLFAAVLPWAAQAQQEERTFRFGIETRPLWLTYGYSNFGVEFYLTNQIGIKVRGGGRDSPASVYESVDDFTKFTNGLGIKARVDNHDSPVNLDLTRGNFFELGVAYYIDGVATSGGYVYGFINNESAEISETKIIYGGGLVGDKTVQLTGVGRATKAGAVIGHRLQGNRWYFNSGLGYANSGEIEIVLDASDGTAGETYIYAGASGVIADLTFGVAF